MEQFPSSSAERKPQPDASAESEQSLIDTERHERVKEAMGSHIVFRVMNLEGHSGLHGQVESGKPVEYTVDNPQYDGQGDWAYVGSEPDGFGRTVDRGYPNQLDAVHAIEVKPDSVVEPYPDDMPGVVYVENGTKVRATPVPREIIDESIDRIHNGQDHFTSEEVVQRMFSQSS